MSVKKLIYFDIRGRGEIIRLVLAAAHESYEDDRINNAEWPTLRTSIKFEQLPVLQLEDGREMNESLAIARFYARKSKLYGNTEWETYLVDRAVDTADDLFQRMKAAHFEEDAPRKMELSRTLRDIHMPYYFNKLTKYIEEGGGDFVAGRNASLGDLMIIVLFDTLVEDKTTYPVLHSAYLKTIEDLPGVKEYLKIRKHTSY